MKGLFKWWIALELCKLVLILISLLVENRTTGTVVLMGLLLLFTVVSYVKAWPYFRKITERLFEEEDAENRKLLSRARMILLFLMVFDLLPFLPGIQAILRYGYHRSSVKVDSIIGLDSSQ